MRKKILFLDMDGTALNDAHQMPEENRTALTEAVRQGHDVIMTTGRPTASAELLFDRFGLRDMGCRYVLTYGCGEFYDCREKRVIYSRKMPKAWLRRLTDEAKRQGVCIQSFSGDQVLTEVETSLGREAAEIIGLRYKVVPDLVEAQSEDPCKAVAIGDHERLKAFSQVLLPWREGKLEVHFSFREFMELLPKGVNKGSGLRACCEYLGLPLEDSIAVGDEENDIPMLLTAGIGCAVANAEKKVRAVAGYVTERDNNHSAVAEVVRKYMLEA